MTLTTSRVHPRCRPRRSSRQPCEVGGGSFPIYTGRSRGGRLHGPRHPHGSCQSVFQHRVDIDLPARAFALGARSPCRLWLMLLPSPTPAPAPISPASGWGQPLEVGEAVGAGALVLRQAVARPLGEHRALGCPCPKAGTVVPTAQLPLCGATCTHYTVTCTHNKDVDMPTSTICNTHTGICRLTVPGMCARVHTAEHIMCTHGCPSLQSHVPAKARPGRWRMSTTSPGPSLLP